MKFDINHFNKFIHRSPILPINEYYKASYDDVSSFLKAFYSNELVKTSLYNSSKIFYDEVVFFLDGKYDNSSDKLNKFYSKAIKYANRMCTRSTPFGGFSGCSIGEIGNETITNRAEHNQIIRKHRLDYEFLYSVVDYLLKNTDIKKYVQYYANNSIYTIGDKHRYVDFNLEKGELSYLLSSFEGNEYVEKILSMTENGISYDVILTYLIQEGNEENECVEFLNDIIDSNIIISELHPNTIGIEYQYQILNILEDVINNKNCNNAEIKNVHYDLKNIIQNLNGLSEENYSVNKMEEIILSIKNLPTSFLTSNYIQIDTTFKYDNNQIALKEIQDIKRGLRAYYKVSQKSFENVRLSEFVKKYEERYEDTPIKLLEVLDPEFGIGYGDYSNEFLVITPIIDNVPVGTKASEKSSFIWNNKMHPLLFNKIREAHTKNLSEIILVDDEINTFDFDIGDIPSTFVAFFNMYETSNGYLYNFKNWASDTATSIIGRFSTLDHTFHELLMEIDEFERSRLNENQTLVEINHLPGLRIGNITTRTNFRKYEIPYIAVQNHNGVEKIDPNNIYVKLFKGHVRLFDVKSGKEIIPILSNAHNYNNNPLPFYRFLSDIQNQSQVNNLSLNINLGIITTLFTHIPRITYKNFIFRAATWTINAIDFKEIFEIKDVKIRKQKLISEFEKQMIPGRCYIADGDNKLFIDIEILFSVSEIILKDELRKRSSIVIEEYIPKTCKEELRSSTNDFYCNEIVIPFKNNSSNSFEYYDFENLIDIAISKKENIPIGSNCLYLKIYIGTISRDKILNEKFIYFIEKLKSENLCKNWFFLRFSDNNNPHLRIRFFKDNINYDKILYIYNEVFYDEINSEIIYKSEITHYKKELIRYGGTSLISHAEDIFQIDSELFLSLSALSEEYGLKEFYWILTLKTIYTYLDAFALDDEEKIKFCTENKIYFAKKFHSSKDQTKIITSNYKDNINLIEEFLDDNTLKDKYPEISLLFENFLYILTELVKNSYKNQVRKKGFLMSFIHMSILRSTISKNIKHEYVFYSFLEIYYKNLIYSKNARV